MTTNSRSLLNYCQTIERYHCLNPFTFVIVHSVQNSFLSSNVDFISINKFLFLTKLALLWNQWDCVRELFRVWKTCFPKHLKSRKSAWTILINLNRTKEYYRTRGSVSWFPALLYVVSSIPTNISWRLSLVLKLFLRFYNNTKQTYLFFILLFSFFLRFHSLFWLNSLFIRKSKRKIKLLYENSNVTLTFLWIIDAKWQLEVCNVTLIKSNSFNKESVNPRY